VPHLFKKLSLIVIREEVDFRWHGNRVLDPGTHTLSLNDFYAHYSTPSNAPVYLQGVPTQWKSFERSRGRFVCLELYVRVDKVCGGVYTVLRI
jgi:hypothetical protein